MTSPDTEGRREVLTLPEIAKQVGAGYRTLKNWRDWGFIQPSVRSTSGTGNVEFYSQRDLELARLLSLLRQRGLSVHALGVVAAELKTDVIWTCPVCRANHEFEEATDA